MQHGSGSYRHEVLLSKNDMIEPFAAISSSFLAMLQPEFSAAIEGGDSALMALTFIDYYLAFYSHSEVFSQSNQQSL